MELIIGMGPPRGEEGKVRVPEFKFQKSKVEEMRLWGPQGFLYLFLRFFRIYFFIFIKEMGKGPQFRYFRFYECDSEEEETYIR